MIASIKNLKGVKQLSKPEQKNVQGGQACVFQYYDKFSGQATGGALLTTIADGPSGSSQANDFCVAHVISTGEGCRYNCEWDD